MKKSLAYIMLFVVACLALVHIFDLNWEDLSWEVNQKPYTGLIIALIIGVFVILRLVKGNPKV